MPSFAVPEIRGTVPNRADWLVDWLENENVGASAPESLSVIRIVTVTFWLPVETLTAFGVKSNSATCGGVVSAAAEVSGGTFEKPAGRPQRPLLPAASRNG